MYNESSGPTLSREAKQKAALHHIRIYGSPNATAERPAWLIEHHGSERDRNPDTHEFSDPHEMLAHVATHSGAPEPDDKGKDE
jgi:hypothetical protein